MKKRIISLLMVSALAATLFAGCGSSDNSGDTANTPDSGNTPAATQSEEKKEVVLPEKLVIAVDGTLAMTKEEHQDAFIEKLQELTGIKTIEIFQPDHKAYYDQLGQKIASGKDIPDVVLLGSTYYSSYAADGVLWDMTAAYDASDLKARHEAKGSNIYVDAVRLDGKLYGMPVERGGGCVTYVRNAWLDKIDGYSPDKLPTTYDEYIDMLKKFKAAGLSKADYVTGGAGFVGPEAPWVNYLPEFYQDADPSFVKDASGKWVDGFTQDSMKAAMKRLADGVKDGLLDQACVTNGTSDARTKFASGEYGAYTYWANHWATNLTNNTKKALPDEDPTLSVLPPIKEVGTYINRLSTVWCITSACENPEGAFKYFIETMQDGGDVQFLWTYGVEGVTYSYAAESITTGSGEKAATKEYKEGQFHWLNTAADPTKAYSKIHITATGNSCLSTLDHASHEDPNAVDEAAQKAIDIFSANCRNAEIIPTTDEMMEYNGDLVTLKAELISNVALGKLTVDEAYAQWEKDGKAKSDAIVESLNK